MKKTSYIFLTVLTIFLSSVLMACSFKSPEASFTQSEMIVSLNETIGLDEFLNVKGISKSDVVYKFSNPEMFRSENNSVKAIGAGKSYVYATYQNNNLASMQIAIRKQFSTPTNINLTNEGVVTWDAVANFFENESTPTKPVSYTVVGTFTPYSADGQAGSPEEINQTVTQNSYQLTQEGSYVLRVLANGSGYFDKSEQSVAQTFYFGFMPQLTETDITFVDGVVSWSAVAGAEYRVKVDEMLFSKQSTNSLDVSGYLDTASAGNHSISVIVYDSQDKKIAKESERVSIKKLSTPNVDYDFSEEGGRLVLSSNQDVDGYIVSARNVSTEQTQEIVISATDGVVYSSLEGLAEGIHEVKVQAKTSGANSYKSSFKTIETKIYKLPNCDLNGDASVENEYNGTTFNAKLTGTAPQVSNQIVVNGAEFETTDGIIMGQTEKQFAIQLPEAGEYTLSAKLLPKQSTNIIGGQVVYVLNSNETAQIQVVKVSAFGAVTHEYIMDETTEKSKFSFDVFDENVVDYIVENNGTALLDTQYQWSENDGKIEIVLNGKVDDFDVTSFDIIAKTANDLLAINSSTTKTLQVLSAPTTANSGNSTDKTYTWTASENADQYTLKIYTLPDKATYDSFAAGTVDTVDLDYTTQVTTTESYTFENVGYYYVEIFAQSTNEDQFLAAKTSLNETIYIAEKLVASDVQFGFKADYVNHSGLTASTGYFVKLQNAENVDAYEISVGGATASTFKIESEDDAFDYLLTDAFDLSETTISVVAKSNDSTLYVDSDPKTVIVVRHGKITYDDVNVDGLTENVIVSARPGASEILIKRTDDENEKATGDSAYDAIYNIEGKTNFSLDFSIKGSLKDGDLYVVSENKVYLDAETTTLEFKRLETPTNFKYYEGDLTFVNNTSESVVVLDVICGMAQGDPITISIQFGDRLAIASYDGLQVPIGEVNTFRTISGSNVTIMLDELLEVLKTDESISNTYNQAVAISFEAYMYKNSANAEKTTYILSSLPATLDGQSGSSLTVEKMPAPTLEFIGETATDFTLGWNAVSVDENRNAETTYEVYLTTGDAPVDGTLLVESDGYYSYEFSKEGYEAGQFYSFYIKAKNPYYLESNVSNIVRIYKLKTLSKVTLGEDGMITLNVSSSDQNFVSKVKVNGTEQDIGAITASLGDLTIELIGKEETNGQVKTYYLNSDVSTWTVVSFDTLAPADSTVSYNAGLLQWNGFTAGTSRLKYKVIFKDESGNVVSHTTTETEFDLLTDEEVYNKISTLSAGEISVQVVAYLGGYEIALSGTNTIYYSAEHTLLDETKIFNAYVYGDGESNTVAIKKLTTPEVVEVEFEQVDFSDVEFDTFGAKTIDYDLLKPTTKIYFTGNYGDTVSASAFINGSTTPIYVGDIAKDAEGNYSFDLTYSNYEFVDGKMTVAIKVNSSEDIPSSLGSVDIYQSIDLSDIGFVEENSKLNPTLEFTFVTDGVNFGAAGGVVVEVDFKQTGDTDFTTLYSLVNIVEIDLENPVVKLDMSEFISTYLSKGGEIAVSAYMNSFVDNTNKNYYLPSQNFTTIDTTYVLKAVEEAELVRKAGGFTINTLNSDSTIYIVEYGVNKTEVVSEDGEFYYEFPDDWVNGSYTLTIYATEDGKLSSAKTNVEFTLTRIDSVQSVSLVRDEEDISQVSFTWNEVENAGGYLLKMYDKETSNLIFEKQLSTASTYTTTEIFGENYQEVIDYGVLGILDFVSDREVSFEIITIGKETEGVIETNNSYAYKFDGKIKGNSLINASNLAEIISIDQFGRIAVSTQNGTTYLYNFYTSAESQDWAEITATSETTYLNSLEFSKLVGTDLFDINLVNKGEQANFEIDSYNVTSEGTSFKLQFNASFTSIGYNDALSSGIAFEILANSYNKVFVGTTEDALFNGLVFEVPVEKSDVPAAETLNEVVSYGFGQLIELFAANGVTFEIDTETTLYFWTYIEDSADKTNKVVASAPYEFTFEYVTEDTFVEIKKNADTVTPADYANVYAVYSNSDDSAKVTRGIYVKISSEDGYEVIKYYTKEQIKSADSTQFLINLTEVFEESDLLGRVGAFNVSFARLQVKDETTFVVTNWIDSYDSQELVFTRLDPTIDLRLSQGNLVWSKIGEGIQYYVYLALDVDAQTLKMNEYSIYSTDGNVFDASNFTGENSKYYLAVQSYQSELLVLPSRRVFISQTIDGVSSPSSVHKNQVNSPIVLEDGQLRINWTKDSEIYKLVTLDASNPLDLLEFRKLFDSNGQFILPFTQPFTFHPADLVNDKVMFRLKFTPVGGVGKEKYFDVNSKDLIASLYEYIEDQDGMSEADIDTKLTSLQTTAAAAGISAEVIDKFKDICKNSSYGVGNHRKLFDEIFETLQMGSYSMQYCLLGSTGNSTTINSVWYDYENAQGENLIYVNGQPDIKVIEEENADMTFTNTYKMLIKKSEITTYDTDYVKQYANNYVMKLKLDDVGNSMAFSIAGSSGSFSLSLLDYSFAGASETPDISTTVSVVETDENGSPVENGAYLMFYLNHNNGNSLLGVFGDIIPKNSFNMQIFAVGNDYSISSKSEFYSLTFLGFGNNLTINNGTFTWVPQQRRTTTVITKSTNAFVYAEESVSAQDDTYARYKLDNKGEGTYEYIKFVMKGEVVGNVIFVDSEVYTLNNIYKLGAPELTNDLGYLGINDAGNESKYALSYSDIDIHKYRIHNNSMLFSETNTATYYEATNSNYETDKTLYYQTGVSGGVAFQESEKSASKFYVTSVGSNVENIKFNVVETLEGDYNTSYHLRELYCTTKDGQLVTAGIAVASTEREINAQMMADVGELSIENSVLSWDAVSTSQDGQLQVAPENVVYKVDVTLYEMTAVDSNTTTETDSSDKVFTYYTTLTEFDFAKIEDDILDASTNQTLLRVSVQALALNVVEETAIIQGKREPLIEGGFVQGNVAYDSSETFVLMGGASEIDGISRLLEVSGLSISNGKLVWLFQTEAGLSEAGFREKFDFNVVQVIDGEETEVKGTYTITEPVGGTYQIFFNENKGSMKAGLSTIKVFVVQGTNNKDFAIKSFSASIDINKLETIQEDDYVIENDVDIETLDFSEYFATAGNEYNTVEATVYINNDLNGTIIFTKEKCKLYILKEESDDLDYSGEYIGRLVINDTQVAKLNFVVKNPDGNIIYSDISQEFLLQRSNWGEGKEILWDATVQMFSWEYDYNAINASVDGAVVEAKYIFTLDTELYSDKQCSELSGLTLVSGTVADIIESDNTSTKISYEEQQYYVKNTSYSLQYLSKVTLATDVLLYTDVECLETAKDPEGLDVTLTKDSEILVLNELADCTKVLYENKVHYILKSVLVEETETATYTASTKRLSLGDLVKVAKASTDTSIVETKDEDYVVVENINIIKPVYTVRAVYGTENLIERVYSTQENVFKPEIIGPVTISVSVKLGSTNVQSVELSYNGTVDFNLFASGDGTSINPYRIDNTTMFENIQYRMTKDEYLYSYYEVGVENAINSDTKYYFTINADISDLQFEGIIFKGDFSGVIYGNNHTISYTSNKTTFFSKSITIDQGNVKGTTGDHTSTTFSNGSALFERFTNTVEISNLKISATFEHSQVISNHSLIAGLVVENSGKIDNVDILGFGTSFVGNADVRLVMVYSGVASVNTGSQALISNCDYLVSSVNLSDSSTSGQGQLLFVSGIAFVNWNGATVSNCSAGANGQTTAINIKCNNSYTIVQVAGIVVTNHNATLKNCVNYCNISVTGAGAENSNFNDVYIAGIACYGKGTTQDNTNNGTLTTNNVLVARLYKGDLYSV